MRIESQLTDEAVLSELGERLARLRLGRDLTQRQLGQRAGVARTVVQRIESGEPVTTANLIRLLRALDLLDALDRSIPNRSRARCRRSSCRAASAGERRAPTATANRQPRRTVSGAGVTSAEHLR